MEVLSDMLLHGTAWTGALLALVGGTVFGLTIIYKRPDEVVESVESYLRRVIMFMILFYFTFPFAQGMFGIYEHHDPNLLAEVTLYYIVFMFGLVLTCYSMRLFRKA